MLKEGFYGIYFGKSPEVKAMFDLNQKFDEIIKKYLPNKYESGNNDLVYSKVYSILRRNCLNKNVAMWGVGDINNISQTYVAKFLEVFADSLQNTKCVIDARKELEGKKILGLPIITSSEITKYDIDIILITSYRSRKFIAKEIKLHHPDITYIDVYEELEKTGLPSDVDIFLDNDKYIDLYDQRMKYNNAVTIEDKKEQFDKLLLMYADIKDIYYMCKMIDECEITDLIYRDKLDRLKKELLNLLETIRNNIYNRKDIIVWFQDAFRNIDWYDSEKKQFKMLNNLSEKSVCFVNSFSTAPVTYESVYSIITGKLPFEGDVYDSDFKFDVEQFEFLNMAVQHGYNIEFYTDESFDIFNPNKKLSTHYKKYVSEIIWAILNKMCDQHDKSALHFAYALKELHVPFMCGYFSDKPVKTIFSKMGLEDDQTNWKDIKRQFNDCLNYVNEELESFFGLLGEESSIIVFSDHAHIVYDQYENKPFYLYYDNVEKSVKNVFMIYNKKWKPEIHNELVSMIDFNEIACQIYEKDSFELPNRKEVYWQYYPVYNKTIRENAAFFNGEDYIDGIECCYDGDVVKVSTPHSIKQIKKV